MDNISSLLNAKGLNQPEEIKLLKNYVLKKYNEKVGVLIRDKDIVILVNSSALANSLRLNQTDLKDKCKITKKILFRVAG
jgi:hypothetical protein